MKPLDILGVALLMAAVSTAAKAECHLKVETVIMCQNPKNAALAYQEFGSDQAKMRASYNLQLLHESWCAIISETSSHRFRFQRIAASKVATPSGWVPVVDLTFFHDGVNDERYVATAYLTGVCAAHTYDPSDEQQDVSRSPYLPSIPEGGYKIPGAGPTP